MRVEIMNSTVSGNMAGPASGTGASYGGGIGVFDWDGNSVITLTNSTVSGNAADGNSGSGGGGVYTNGETNVRNTVISGNTAHTNNDVADDGAVIRFVSNSANLIGTDDTTGGDFAGDIVGVPPGLGTLANNGGPTMTHALLAGSPAIDVGENAAATAAGLTTDQRGAGFARVVNGTVDIGAYEVQATPTPPTLVTLSSFTNTAMPGRVLLEWETSAEKDCHGFHILRSDSTDGKYTRITASAIPAKGGVLKGGVLKGGAKYVWADYGTEPEQSRFYRLEEVDTSGQSHFYDPTSSESLLTGTVEGRVTLADVIRRLRILAGMK